MNFSDEGFIFKGYKMVQSYEDMRRRERETANVGERLLAEGKKITYAVDDLPTGEHVVEYPDGRRFVIRTINGKRVEQEPYHGK